MSIINKGTSFANGEQLTADKINDLVDLATFNQNATDSQTTDVNSSGQIVVNQGGIDTAQLATGAVTKSKIENVANMKALGNTSGSASEPREVAILDENDMLSDSATSLATQKSIKAYTDSKTSDPARVYNNLAHSTTSGTTQKNTTGRPLWVSFTLLSNGGGLNYLLGEISPNDDMSAPNTRIGQSRVVSQSGYSSAGQVTMIVPVGYSWKFSYSPNSTTERVHSSFIL